MQNEYLVSIVIPHYNSPELLGRLLESVPDREDYQIVVVDDNSTKDLEILEKCKEQYSSSKCLFLRNTTGKNSAGTCRNIGLEHAKGKWLLFADADDVFLPQTEEILNKYMDSEYDIVFFTPTSFNYETGNKANRHVDIARMIDKYIDNRTREAELRLRYFQVCPWSKLVRKAIVDEYKIRYDSTMVSNDVMFSTKCGHYANKIFATKEEIYCATKTKGSLVTQSSEKNYDIRTNVLIDKYLYLRENLSKEDCKLIGLDGLPVGRIYETWRQYKSMKKVFAYLKLFRKNKVKVFTWRLLNPVVVFHAMKKKR